MTTAFCVVIHICPPQTVGIIVYILSYPRSICNGFHSNKTRCRRALRLGAAARRSALFERTFASQASPAHMPPEKMVKTLFAPAGANSARHL